MTELHEDYIAAHDLALAICHTVDYVGNDVLPPLEGWSWFDALMRYSPAMARKYIEKPITLHSTPHSVIVNHVLFQGKKDDPTSLSEVIGVGSGAISACWSDLSGAGTFESQRASVIVDEIIAWIEAHYVPMSTYRDDTRVLSSDGMPVKGITGDNE